MSRVDQVDSAEVLEDFHKASPGKFLVIGSDTSREQWSKTSRIWTEEEFPIRPAARRFAEEAVKQTIGGETIYMFVFNDEGTCVSEFMTN